MFHHSAPCIPPYQAIPGHARPYTTCMFMYLHALHVLHVLHVLLTYDCMLHTTCIAYLTYVTHITCIAYLTYITYSAYTTCIICIATCIHILTCIRVSSFSYVHYMHTCIYNIHIYTHKQWLPSVVVTLHTLAGMSSVFRVPSLLADSGLFFAGRRANQLSHSRYQLLIKNYLVVHPS